jgi:hypothetical protein
MANEFDSLVIDAFTQRLRETYQEVYSNWKPECEGATTWAASIAAQIHANLGDAPYHDTQHVIDVTLVGLEILRGRHVMERVSPDDWMHFLIACAFHDVGFVKRLLPEDQDKDYPRGTTGAVLSKVHVDRGKQFVQFRFADNPFIDGNLLADYIEQTRFPAPDEERYKETDSLRGLVRAADLIGQLANMHLARNQWGLFQEFEETGQNEQFGYHTVDDLRDKFPAFFFNIVHPYIKDGIRHLERTVQGKQIVNNLFANVFRAQHNYWPSS